MVKRKDKNKEIWILSLGIGVVFSLYFAYRTIMMFSLDLGQPMSYAFTRYFSLTILLIFSWTITWIFICCLIPILIKQKNIIAWGAFFGGIITFFYAYFFVKLDLAGGAAQLGFITTLGIICGIVIGFFIQRVIIKERENNKK